MIVFSGLDGAGKSTQISLVQTYLKEVGQKTQLFWSRGGYTPGMESLKGLMRKTNSSKIPSQRGNSAKREQSFSNSLVRKVWLSLAILDLIYYYGIYIRFKELFGTVIICDRYIFDTSIDFKLNFPQENVHKWWLWKLLLIAAVKPKSHFVLTISVAESKRRSLLKDEPFPDTVETLKNRLQIYLNFVAKNKFAIHIDCSKSIEDVNNEILKELNLKTL